MEDYTFTISSQAFTDGGKIPVQYCGEEVAGGANVSLPFEWQNVPEQAKSLLLVIVDTHPVAKNWIHWAVKNIPTNISTIEENASNNNMSLGTIELIGTEGIKGYRGPEPPPGTGDHSYEVHLFALDIESVPLPDQPNWDQIQAAVSGHTLAEAKITGYFGR